MRCPHCGTPASCNEAGGFVEWHCPDGCGASGKTPMGITPEDTQIEARREARQGPDPLTEEHGLPF